MKIMVSEMMNKIIPFLNIIDVLLVCIPLRDLSILIEFHHKMEESDSVMREKVVRVIDFFFRSRAVFIKRMFRFNEEIIGHGLGFNKWNGFIFFIIFLRCRGRLGLR